MSAFKVSVFVCLKRIVLIHAETLNKRGKQDKDYSFGEIMQILIGKYIKKDDHVIAVRLYSHIPDWISYVLYEAVNQHVEIPNTIVICNRVWYKQDGRLRAYMYKGVNGDIVDTAICFTYKMEQDRRMYTLAHEIGHCDHWKKGIVLKTDEEMEDYANRIAERITGKKLIKSTFEIE